MAHVTDFKEAGFNTLLEELEWRGLISQSTDRDRLAEALNGEPITYYCGFDPTAASLHIGNLVQLINMRHLQLAGHHPIALVGGATGLIGDPRQSGERTLNPKDVVAGWADRLKNQIGGILDTEGANAVRFVSNYDWTASMTVIDFLRDVGKNFRLGTMLAKDTVARRLNSEEGISFTEFSYQVLQGNDFLHLFDVNVFTSPIITDASGKKFGKSEGNAVWLDATMLSPYKFYQFWINRPDVEMESLLKAFTFLPKAEIERLVEESKTNPGKREAQKTLAWEVTSFVHGEAATQAAIDASGALFGRGGNLEDIDEETLESVLDGFKVVDENGEHVFPVSKPGDRVIDAAQAAGLFKSASEARRAIKSGGVYLNNNRIEDEEQVLAEADFLAGRFALIRRGKKALGAVENR